MTRARFDEIETAERVLPVEAFVDTALRASVLERFEWPLAAAAAGAHR